MSFGNISISNLCTGFNTTRKNNAIQADQICYKKERESVNFQLKRNGRDRLVYIYTCVYISKLNKFLNISRCYMERENATQEVKVFLLSYVDKEKRDSVVFRKW